MREPATTSTMGGHVVLCGLSELGYRPSIPERYRVADDLRRPLAEVVAVAEQEAITAPARQRLAPDGRVRRPAASQFHR